MPGQRIRQHSYRHLSIVPNNAVDSAVIFEKVVARKGGVGAAAGDVPFETEPANTVHERQRVDGGEPGRN